MRHVTRGLARAVIGMTLLLCACQTEDPELAGKPLSQWSQQLDSGDRHDRLAAIRAVGEMARRHPDVPSAAAALRGALRNDDRAVRHWAVRSVNTLGEAARDFEDDLRERLTDEVPDVRVWAAYGLCRLGKTEEALPVLAQALSDSNGATRLHAAHALEALGEQARPVAEELRGVLGDEFGYPDRVAGRFLKSLDETKTGQPQ